MHLQKTLLKMLIISASFSFATPITAQAATGEMWDVKMKMSGLDMDMPSQQVCMAKDKMSEKDVQGDEGCRTTSFKALGPNHVKYSFACKDGSTGDGDLERTAKTFKQTMNMVQNGEKTTMNSQGTNTGKVCDPDAGKKKMASALAQACEDATKRMDGYGSFFPKKKDVGLNCDQQKAAYCSFVKSTAATMIDSKVFEKNAFSEGYDAKTAEEVGTWQKAVTACGAGNPDSIKKSACKNGVDTGNYQMVQRFCPAENAELNALYKRECVGRNYTSNKLNQKYASFCSNFSSGSNASNESKEEGSGSASNSSSGSNSSNTDSNKGTTSPVDGAVKGAKKLKDLFGF